MKKKRKKDKPLYCVQTYCRRCGGYVSYTMSSKDKPISSEHSDWERCIQHLAGRISELEKAERDRNWF